jgi:hypothetical protein
MTATEHGPENSTAALLRAALLDDLEAVMSATDTERELHRFRSGVTRRHRRSRLVGAAAAGLVAVAAVGALVAVRAADDDPSRLAGSSDEVTGEMALILRGGGTILDGLTDQQEYRDFVWSGEVSLDVGRPLRGTVRLVLDGSGVYGPNGMTVWHGVGAAEAELDGQRCAGTYGLNYYAEPHESGGAMQLRCEDGSVLGLSLAVTEHKRIGTARWGADIEVDGGYYRAG